MRCSSIILNILIANSNYSYHKTKSLITLWLYLTLTKAEIVNDHDTDFKKSRGLTVVVFLIRSVLRNRYILSYRFPRFINEVICKPTDRQCLTDNGNCIESALNIPFRMDVNNIGLDRLSEWPTYMQTIRAGCQCEVRTNSVMRYFVWPRRKRDWLVGLVVHIWQCNRISLRRWPQRGRIKRFWFFDHEMFSRRFDWRRGQKLIGWILEEPNLIDWTRISKQILFVLFSI